MDHIIKLPTDGFHFIAFQSMSQYREGGKFCQTLPLIVLTSLFSNACVSIDEMDHFIRPSL